MPEVPRLPLAIVVGVEGSPQSATALRWAATQSELTGAPLIAVNAWHAPGLDLAAAHDEGPAAAHSILLATITDALGAARGAMVDARVSLRAPADALLELAPEARLLVVGPHAGATVTGLLLGSVPERVICEASCPVAVIRATEPDRTRIVVGLDGSSFSRCALDWAVRQAWLIGGRVDAIVAWDWTPHYAVYPYGPNEQVRRRAAEHLLAHELSTLVGADRSVVTGHIACGHPAKVLIGAARGAGLLVVGNRGAGAGLTHRLGSVSLKCARHAVVSVAVVHGR